MRVIKNINNNVSLCIDDNGNEVVVFGKGIGFKRPPYELEDLKLIDKTYYNINANYMNLFNSIPENFFLISNQIIDYAKIKYKMELNPNILMTLTDHISFIVERSKKGYEINYTSFYNLKYLNRDVYDVGVFAVKLIEKTLDIELFKDEEYGIAFHFLDARHRAGDVAGKENLYNKKITAQVLNIIEEFYHIRINKDEFDYIRFVNHLNFLLTRSNNLDWIDTENLNVFESMKREFPDVYRCACQISDFFVKELGWLLNEEEQIYLMLHINRLRASEKQIKK